MKRLQFGLPDVQRIGAGRWRVGLGRARSLRV